MVALNFTLRARRSYYKRTLGRVKSPTLVELRQARPSRTLAACPGFWTPAPCLRVSPPRIAGIMARGAPRRAQAITRMRAASNFRPSAWVLFQALTHYTSTRRLHGLRLVSSCQETCHRRLTFIRTPRIKTVTAQRFGAQKQSGGSSPRKPDRCKKVKKFRRSLSLTLGQVTPLGASALSVMLVSN